MPKRQKPKRLSSKVAEQQHRSSIAARGMCRGFAGISGRLYQSLELNVIWNEEAPYQVFPQILQDSHKEKA
jgi:hypothetical protein